MNFSALKPFFSITIFISTLFSLVFLQMEETRMSYHLMQLNRELKRTVAERRLKHIQFVKATRPQKIEQMATSNSSLAKPVDAQIIHLNGPILE